jgi:hypothetical protein
MTTIQDAPRYASPVDRFQGRITADGSSGYRAEPDRYHLYISWGCPWAQRTAIVRKLMGLQDVVSLSYVDDRRDGRGWAFRERRGPDPVNGFRFLAEAYEITEPGYDGHVSVPVLWDRASSTTRPGGSTWSRRKRTGTRRTTARRGEVGQWPRMSPAGPGASDLDASRTRDPASFPTCSSARNADEVSCLDDANCRRLRGAAARGHVGPQRSDLRHRA